MVQPTNAQMPNYVNPQAGGANAVSINIYNPQAYGSTPQGVQQPPYNYQNSLYQMPQGAIYGPQSQAQFPPSQYYMPQVNPQAAVQPAQPFAMPAPMMMPGNIVPPQMQDGQPVQQPYVMPQAIAQVTQPVIAPAPQMMPGSVIPAQVQNEQTVVEQPKTEETQEAQKTEETSEAQKTENKDTVQSVDTDALIKDLKSGDATLKGEAINKLAQYAQDKPEVALQVVSEPVMQALVDVIKEDTSNLEGPTDKQIEIAEKISKQEKLTPEEEELSNQLSPRDTANKNRIFALYTLAMIQKLQRDELNQYIETQKANGEQPVDALKLEDLIGYSDVVNTIKNDPRPEVKVAAIQALEHVAEAGDKAKVEEVLADSVKSKDEPIKAAAKEALSKFDAQ